MNNKKNVITTKVLMDAQGRITATSMKYDMGKSAFAFPFPEDFDFSRQSDWRIADGALVHDPLPSPVMRQKARAEATVQAVRMMSAVLPDEQVFQIADLYDEWITNTKYEADMPLWHEGQLYRVVQPHTSQAHQPPGSEGMLAVYRPLIREANGTRGDPIPFVHGMDVEKGKMYSYEGALYTPDRDVQACTHYPGAAGVHFWLRMDE